MSVRQAVKSWPVWIRRVVLIKVSQSYPTLRGEAGILEQDAEHGYGRLKQPLPNSQSQLSSVGRHWHVSQVATHPL